MRASADLTPFGLFRRIVSPSLLRRLAQKHGWSFRLRTYTASVVLWLMIVQRLQAPGTMSHAVSQVCEKKLTGLLARGRRRGARRRRMSSRTGAFCRARQRIPLAMCRDVVETMIAGLEENYLPSAEGRRIYIIDGSSLQLQERGNFLDLYPPAQNQHGRAHWPVLRLVVLHDARTGLAMRPAWGPMSGPRALSEQALAERLIPQMQPASVLLGDRNFGVFSIAYSAVRQQQSVLLRLTRDRAKKIAGGSLTPGLDVPVVWPASPWDRKMHPELSADASVRGRLLVCVMAGWSEPLYLFTTLIEPAAEVVRCYQLRWNIETDLRSLKQAARLHRLTPRSDAMLEKELLMAMAAYNLVRAIMCLAADQAQIHPRELSFTHVMYHVNACLPDLLTSWPSPRSKRQLRHLLLTVTGCKLPKRKKRRSYPREVWARGYRFPVRRDIADAQSK